ncbi:MAG: helix-turn-helix domain-containing protein [Pseudonocardiaceae bacterium]
MADKRHRLVSIRKAAGFSQERLAEVLGVERTTVMRWERGETRPQPWARPKIARTLGISDQALSELLGEPADDQKSADRTTGAVIDLFDGAPAGADYVESLHGTIKHLAALDGVHGRVDIAPVALHSFRRAQLILREGRYEPAVERELEAATAEIGELSGWLLFDAERHDECRQVNAEALTLARIAGDVSMEWFVLSNQALASVHTGRNQEALRIAQGMTCGHDLPGLVRALFDVRAGRAFAALGDATSALRVFDRAKSAFSDGTTTRDPPWSWWFDERELAGHEGMIHAALGDHSRALPNLATAVERSEGRECFRWALYIHRAHLLRTLLRAGSWAEAERIAIDIVPMVGTISSARTEGLLRRALTRPETRPQMPSTLSDTLDYIGNRLQKS